eukprot:scaffold1071_cov166-Amphora_coffeaeformis.AAC.8
MPLSIISGETLTSSKTQLLHRLIEVWDLSNRSFCRNGYENTLRRTEFCSTPAITFCRKQYQLSKNIIVPYLDL